MTDNSAVTFEVSLGFYGTFKTVGDIRHLVALLDQYKIPDSQKCDDGCVSIYVNVPAGPIECGGCGTMDVLASLHECDAMGDDDETA